jgi:[acyl-carrier-protein] S-malonyltransferase
MTKTAVLFPPQVYIEPGEYRDLYDSFSTVRLKFSEATRTLGFDLADAFFSDDPDQVNRGTVARPAIVSISSALYDKVRARMPGPSYLAGLSLGQITAAHISGAITFSDAIRMAHTMASVEEEHFSGNDYGVYFYYNIDISRLLAVMEEMEFQGHYLKPCAYTADDQMIVSGRLCSLEELNVKALELGGLGVVIPYGPPAHCPLMEEVKEAFSRTWRYQDKVKDPEVPLICNLAADVIDQGQTIQQVLVEQYTQTVKWAQSIRRMAALGVERLVVIGPGHFVQKSLGFLSVSFAVECYLGLPDLMEADQAGRISE